MKEKFMTVKRFFSCFLILYIFLTMPFIIIEKLPQTTDVSAVFYEMNSYGLTPSQRLELITVTEGNTTPSKYIFLPPDHCQPFSHPCCQSEESDKKTAETVRGVNGVPKVEYSEEDLYWLSRIIYAEAGTEPFEGMIAVGSVVMNRVASENYPDTVYEVIFDKKFGVQFTPAATGTVYRTPSRDAITAAKICLTGYSISEEILFFLNERIATSTWTRDNCQYVMTIGNHDFYA